jgi:signal transduction histidine kinase
MAGSRSSTFSRRLLLASLVFGVLVLANLALFSWLIFRQLSQREINRALLETRTEAQELASRIQERTAGENDLYVVMAFNREIVRYISEELMKMDTVADLEIYDENGSLVYRLPADGDPSFPAAGDALPQLPREPGEPPGGGEEGLKVRERIGDLGWVQIGINRGELEQRTAVLRRDLLRTVITLGAGSLLALVSAYVLIWILLARARRLEAEKDEADRLAYLGTLAAGLAHEIRNPLNSLNLNMQMLEEELRDGPSVGSSSRLLSITSSEIGRLERLVTDFLSYARPRPLELESVRPLRLFEELQEVLAGELQARGAEVDVVDDSEGASIAVDAGQMRQLLLNLVQNALHATEDSPRAPRLTLSAHLRPDRKLELVVEDNGAGIGAPELARIFEIFYSTRKGGTGLGLAVVDRIARAHGATIEVASTPGSGTRFTVVLPRDKVELDPNAHRRSGTWALNDPQGQEPIAAEPVPER